MPHKDPEAARAYRRAFYLAHHEEMLRRASLANKKHYQNNKDKIRQKRAKESEAHKAYCKLYYQNHKEAHKLRNQSLASRTKNIQRLRAMRGADPEGARAKARAYYAANKARIKLRDQASGVPAKQSAYRAALRAADPEGIRAKNRAYAAAHPEQAATKARNRRARIWGVENRLTHEQWLLIQEHQHHLCYYCGTRCKGKLTQDHITPLSKGGTHTLHNVIAACKSCNSRKNAGPPPIPVQPLLL